MFKRKNRYFTYVSQNGVYDNVQLNHFLLIFFLRNVELSSTIKFYLDGSGKEEYSVLGLNTRL